MRLPLNQAPILPPDTQERRGAPDQRSVPRSLRWRLTGLLSALCALALLLVGWGGYAAYVRGQYQAIDRALVVSASQAAAGVRLLGSRYVASVEPQALDSVVRLWAQEGVLLGSNQPSPLPLRHPEATLLSPDGPAHSPLVGLWPLPVPGFEPPRDSAYGTVDLGGQRWRQFVLRVPSPQGVPVYVESWLPLGRLDSGVEQLRGLLLGLTALALTLFGLLGHLVLRRALEPLRELTEVARQVSESGDLTLRVREAAEGGGGEVAALGATFNRMLGALQEMQGSQSRFVADASHELRAPLTVMAGNLEMLSRYPLSGPEREEVLAELRSETLRLSRLVNDLLQLARAEGQLQPALDASMLDLGAELRRLLPGAQHLARGQRLRYAGPDDPVTIEADRGKLRQLLLILVDNALKFTPPGGEVVLSLSTDFRRALVEVRDTGPGIPEDELERVFERFYRLDPARSREPFPGGTGLGLSIARRLAEAHGGSLRLLNREGGGLRAQLWLPRYTDFYPAGTAELLRRDAAAQLRRASKERS